MALAGDRCIVAVGDPGKKTEKGGPGCVEKTWDKIHPEGCAFKAGKKSKRKFSPSSLKASVPVV